MQKKYLLLACLSISLLNQPLYPDSAFESTVKIARDGALFTLGILTGPTALKIYAGTGTVVLGRIALAHIDPILERYRPRTPEEKRAIEIAKYQVYQLISKDLGTTFEHELACLKKEKEELEKNSNPDETHEHTLKEIVSSLKKTREEEKEFTSFMRNLKMQTLKKIA